MTLSQGSHFFQNLTSLGVGYLAVDPLSKERHIDWHWLAKQDAAAETKYVRHLRLSHPLDVRLDGRSRRGVIFKPDASHRAC